MEITKLKKTTPTKDELYHLYWEDNLNAGQISGMLSYHPQYIRYLLRKYQIPIRLGKPPKHICPPREELYHLYWEEHLTQNQIAEKYGATTGWVVWKWFKKLNIPVRDVIVRTLEQRTAIAKKRKRQTLVLLEKALEQREEPREFQVTPEYIVGLTDGEGSFSIGLDFRSNPPSAYLDFSIDNTNKPILEMAKEFFGFGSLSPGCQGGNKTCYKYSVRGIRDQLRIAQFFLEHPLFIKAHAFRCWLQALQLIIKNEHRTEQGFRQIVLLKEVINAH